MKSPSKFNLWRKSARNQQKLKTFLRENSALVDKLVEDLCKISLMTEKC